MLFVMDDVQYCLAVCTYLRENDTPDIIMFAFNSTYVSCNYIK